MINFFQSTFTHILGRSADSLATSILPALSPLLAERNLGASQFEILVSTYYLLTQKVISLRCKELGVAEVRALLLSLLPR